MKKCVLAVFAAVAVVSAASGIPSAEEFGNPGKCNRPETWFHLIGANVSKEGIAADIEAIAKAGYGGIQFFHGYFKDGKDDLWPGVTNQIVCLSRQWDDLVAFTAKECKRLGLSFKLQNCPGWSMSGGPWITPSTAMRELTSMCVNVISDGERPVKAKLDHARDAPEPWRDYRDVAALAFPTPDGAEGVSHKPVKETLENNIRILEFAEPVTVRTVSLPSPREINHDHSYNPDAVVDVFCLDGSGEWKKIRSVAYPVGCWQDRVPFSIAVPATASRKWKIAIKSRYVVFFGFAKLSPLAMLDNWQAHAGWVLRGLSWNRNEGQNPSEWIDAEKILDVGEYLSPDGAFSGMLPKGKWTIMRIGHVNMGRRNHPAPPEATGWECDKLDPRGIEANFAGYAGRLAQGPLKGLVDGVLIDSWECQRQTWTWRMPEFFRDACGYDLKKKLPAVFGWIVGTPGDTAEFLLDWRRTIAGLVAENYYKRFADLARAEGLSVQYETSFGDVIPGDLMKFWKWSDEPMCEFWQPYANAERGGVGSYEFKPVRPCVSAAHVYGKRRVAAEAFTSFELTWNEDFKLLKDVANRHFAKGVTHLVTHTYTHNPRIGWKKPGSSFGNRIGTPFLRGQTWWRFMPRLTAYFARCGRMLEAGMPVVDTLRYLGDDCGPKPSEDEHFPAGRKLDYVNYDALSSRFSFKDGAFETPEGLRYAAIWVPEGTYLSAESEKLLKKFEKQGATIFRKSLAEFERMLDGRMARDFTVRGGGELMWYHRSDGKAHWYFVAAGKNGFSGTVDCRASGEASIWDPVSGEIREAVRDGAGVRLSLASFEAVFICFNSGAKALPARNSPHERVRLAGVWKLYQPVDAGGKTLELESLVPWWRIDGVGEASHAYSGTMRYEYSLEAPAGAVDGSCSAVLEFDRIESWAEVFVNGTLAGTLWCKPYRVDITGMLKPGVNRLEVDVTSTWRNRMIFDARQPREEDRVTWTIAGPEIADKYSDYGLVGHPWLCIEKTGE